MTSDGEWSIAKPSIWRAYYGRKLRFAMNHDERGVLLSR
jgi:hypothetical protein